MAGWKPYDCKAYYGVKNNSRRARTSTAATTAAATAATTGCDMNVAAPLQQISNWMLEFVTCPADVSPVSMVSIVQVHQEDNYTRNQQNTNYLITHRVRIEEFNLHNFTNQPMRMSALLANTPVHHVFNMNP